MLLVFFSFLCFTHFHLECDYFIPGNFTSVLYYVRLIYFLLLQSLFIPLELFSETFSPHLIFFLVVLLCSTFTIALFFVVLLLHLFFLVSVTV